MAFQDYDHGMNLRDLRYLVALADERHFGRAAARCHVSQPTLSAQVRKLEEYLGVALLERQPRRLSLTEAGSRVVERARRVLLEADAIVELARSDRDPLAGSLKVALIPTVGPYLLPHVARQLRRDLPRLKLMLYEYQTEPLLAKLRSGEIDVGILALPVPQDGLDTCVLYEEPFTVAVPAGHPLAARDRLKLEDLRGETLLLLEDGHCLRDQALDVCHMAGAGEKNGFRATSLETLRQMVAANVGITLLPMLAVKPPVSASDGVRLLRFRDATPNRRIALAWRKSSAVGDFLQKLAAVIRDLPRGLLDPRSVLTTPPARRRPRSARA